MEEEGEEETNEHYIKSLIPYRGECYIPLYCMSTTAVRKKKKFASRSHSLPLGWGRSYILTCLTGTGAARFWWTQSLLWCLFDAFRPFSTTFDRFRPISTGFDRFSTGFNRAALSIGFDALSTGFDALSTYFDAFSTGFDAFRRSFDGVSMVVVLRSVSMLNNGRPPAQPG